MESQQNLYNYIIPSDNRELQPFPVSCGFKFDYIIPSDNRELQQLWHKEGGVLIISYQVITGNYNFLKVSNTETIIISYQVITGNYNVRAAALGPV